jgi:hypothetical protein
MSSDGVSWKRVGLSGFGGGTVFRIEAGSTGYVATGVGPGTARAPYVWISKDGVTWTGTSLETATVKGVEVTNAVSFAGGFVIAGAAPDPNGGCGAGTITPSLWWSLNGKAWTKDTVSGTTPGDNASFRVYRIGDHALLAHESSYSVAKNETTDGAWTSTDGRTWKQTADPAFTANTVLSYKAKGVLVSSPVDPTSHADVWDIRADLTVVKLAQSGSIPNANSSAGLVALGPAGLVACNSDGSQFWVGAPTVG